MRRNGLRGRAIVLFTALGCAVGGVARGEPVSNCFETYDVDLYLRFAADSDDWRQREELAKERSECSDGARFRPKARAPSHARAIWATSR